MKGYMHACRTVTIILGSIVVSGMITDYVFGEAGLMGMVSGILLFTWVRFLYDRIEENQQRGDNKE